MGEWGEKRESVIVEFDVEHFDVVDADAHMSTLMVLIAIETADATESAIGVNLHLVYTEDAYAADLGPVGGLHLIGLR